MNKPYIYTETAFHHEGNLDYLLRLVDASVDAGAKGIKFQIVFDLGELIATSNPAYQKLESYVFTETQWREVFGYAVERGLDIIAMPLDRASFSLLEYFRPSVKFVELHSVAYHDEELKSLIKASGIDIIFGAGGRTLTEVVSCYRYFGEQLRVLMVGFQAFPSAISDVRLSRIKLLKKYFPNLEIGYADHSSFDDEWGVDSNLLAYSLGARVFEKHITVNQGESRVDYESSVNGETIAKICRKLLALPTILSASDDEFSFSDAEEKYRNRQKMVVAAEPIQDGTQLDYRHLKLKMVGRFDGYPRIEDLVGRKVCKTIQWDTIITPSDVNN
ncbi:MAG: hypothetical protein DI538_29100 [Azospira oryzae]|nr:MAG: hypothetical protein DI538_29100 [Azospira oryzae]